METRLAALLLLVAVAVYPALCLPVAVKNVADVPLNDYAVFFLVERKVLGEWVDPASVCAFDPLGGNLPLWVVPETLKGEKLAVYVKIRYLEPGQQIVIRLEPGQCVQNPKEVFTFFDDFTTLDPRVWVTFATPMVYDVKVVGGAAGGKGLYISGTYMAPQQYVQVVSSQPFAPPLAVEALITPITAYDHDAGLDLREYGTEGAHPSEARGAYIHAWGWGVPGIQEGMRGRFTWYRLAGPPGSPTYYWDMTVWDEGGSSPVFDANGTFLFRIGVTPDVVRYEVWQLEARGLAKLLGHTFKPGIANETVIALVQECGGAYNFTQKALFHWVLVRPFVWPEPKVAVGAEEVKESPLEPLIEFLSKPTNLVLTLWGAAVIVLTLVLIAKSRRRR